MNTKYVGYGNWVVEFSSGGTKVDSFFEKSKYLKKIIEF